MDNLIHTIPRNSIMSTFWTDHVLAIVSIGPISNFSLSIIAQKTFLIQLFYLRKMTYPNTILKLIKIVIDNLTMTIKFGI